jgi:CRISPR-associated exonuclease Cas4
MSTKGLLMIDITTPVDSNRGSAEPPPIPLMVTHVLEHLYCPRFTYFEYVLAVPERQERRLLVQKGRQSHEERKRINPNYLRKKLGVVQRQFDVPLASTRLGLRGSVDEVLTMDDGSMAPFDYKYAEYRDRVYHNLKVQSVLYGLLIRETFQRPVHRGFLCYLRSKHKIVPIEFTDADFAEAEALLREILEIIQTGRFPKATSWKSRCRDCCYRNICIQ